MMNFRAAIVAVGIAGAILVGAPGVASAATTHTQHVHGSAHGTETVTTDASCDMWHVSGQGTVHINGNNDQYELNGCSYGFTQRDGSLAYHLSADYTVHEGGDVLAGHIEGTSALLKNNTLRHNFSVLIEGGTGKFTLARGTLRITGTGKYDYTDGIKITDDVRVAGRLVLAS